MPSPRTMPSIRPARWSSKTALSAHILPGTTGSMRTATATSKAESSTPSVREEPRWQLTPIPKAARNSMSPAERSSPSARPATAQVRGARIPGIRLLSAKLSTDSKPPPAVEPPSLFRARQSPHSARESASPTAPKSGREWALSGPRTRAGAPFP